MPLRAAFFCRAWVFLAAIVVAPCVQAELSWLDTPLQEVQARAMLARFGYGATPRSVQQATTQTPRQFLERAITQPTGLPAEAVAVFDGLASEPLETVWARHGQGGSVVPPKDAEGFRQLRAGLRRYSNELLERRLLAMANSDNPGHEALLAFWLNHFSIYAYKGRNELLHGDYASQLEAALREDSFEALVKASFFHPAMQIYLDNVQSLAPDSPAGRQVARQGKAVGINENLARELLELHTLGVDGGYTQADVQALARIITGAGVWPANLSEEQLRKRGAVRRGFFLFDPRRHDAGGKRFLGTDFAPGGGIEEMERALHLMATHPATARHIARKLARRFLADEPSAAIVAAMADGFLDSGGRLSATLLPLLASPDFQASLAAPAKFKEPLDYVLSVARTVCGDRPILNGPAVLNAARDMGQLPLMRTTPEGYGAQEADWLSPVAMAQRARFAMAVARGGVRLGDVTSGGAVRPGASPAAGATPVCRADPLAIGQALGDVRLPTLRALVGLTPVEQAALLLASPEFMRR